MATLITYGNSISPEYEHDTKQTNVALDEKKGASAQGDNLGYNDSESEASVKINAGAAKTEAAQAVWNKTSRLFLFVG